MPRCCTWTASRAGRCRANCRACITARGSEDDPLLLGVADVVPVPHSRRNDVVEGELTAKGYRILSRLATARPTSSPASCLAAAGLSSSRAIRNMAPTRWAANICATWAASCAARAPAPRHSGKLFRPRHGRPAGRDCPIGRVGFGALFGHCQGRSAAQPVAGQYGAAVRQLADTGRGRQGAEAGITGRPYPPPGVLRVEKPGKPACCYDRKPLKLMRFQRVVKTRQDFQLSQNVTISPFPPGRPLI